MPKTSWKNQYVTLSNESKFHQIVREIFSSSPVFSHMRCFQEVPVHELIEGYPNKQHRFDWYIEELKLVIELHGKQHYTMVNYGNEPYNTALNKFRRIQESDAEKKFAALEAGLSYLEISYKQANKLNAETLAKLIFQEVNSD